VAIFSFDLFKLVRILWELNVCYNMNYLKKSILWLFLCLVYQGVTAQNHAPFERITILKESVFSTPITGYQPQVVKKSNASSKFLGTKPNFLVEYRPDSSYVGTDTFIVEYRDSEDWFRSKIQFLSLVIEVVPSITEAKQDYYTMNQGDTLMADVLANDESNSNSLKLEPIAMEANGELSIINDQLQYIPDAGFTGVTSFQYRTCDSLGACDFGYVSVLVNGKSHTSDTVYVAVKENKSIDLPLNETTFFISDSAENGSLILDNSYILSYSPNTDFYGQDSFEVENANGDFRWYRANVLEKKDKRHTLVDDVAFTEINQEVWIDVQANDVTDNFKVKTLKQPGQGSLFYVDSVKMYKYIPPLDIESIEEFDYGLKGGKIGERATASIYINDGHPDASKTYELTTEINAPILLDYHIPIKGHEFKIKGNPRPCKVSIYNRDTTVEVTPCDSVTGSHFIVIEPGYNLVGRHPRITFEHCVTGTSICQDIHVILTTEGNKETCPCVDDCVWAGDVNYDGRVNMKDLLPLAHHLGLSGNTRSGSRQDWLPQRSSAWNQKIDGSHVNLKHADTDGDGLLSSTDTESILDNYFREHSMVPDLVGPSRKYAWYLQPRFDTVKAGELAVIDVVFGDASHPIEDMEGVAYTVNFSPHVKYDSASLEVVHYPSSFLTSNSPYLALDKQPNYRRIDVGVARTSGTEANGFGIINTLETIIEEDLAGFKSSSGIVPFTIDLSGASGISSNGQTFDLPDGTVTMYVDYGNRKVPFSADRLIVWPNPAQGVFNIHLNGDEEMQSAELYSMDGRMIQSWNHLDPDRHRMIVSPDLKGAYLLRVMTTAGAVTKKIQLLGH